MEHFLTLTIIIIVMLVVFTGLILLLCIFHVLALLYDLCILLHFLAMALCWLLVGFLYVLLVLVLFLLVKVCFIVFLYVYWLVLGPNDAHQPFNSIKGCLLHLVLIYLWQIIQYQFYLLYFPIHDFINNISVCWIMRSSIDIYCTWEHPMAMTY